MLTNGKHWILKYGVIFQHVLHVSIPITYSYVYLFAGRRFKGFGQTATSIKYGTESEKKKGKKKRKKIV